MDLVTEPEQLNREIQEFIGRLAFYPRGERQEIVRALRWSQIKHRSQKRASGEPYLIHLLKTAEILIDLKMEPATIKAALLHDVLEDTEVKQEELEEAFGKDVASLVEGVTKIHDMGMSRKRNFKAESLRKMVWAMVKDIRVIFIKLADKLHNMSTLHYFQDKQKRERIARECLEIYAPIAGKLGMSWIKSELEDQSLKVLQEDIYTQIRTYVAKRRKERKESLDKIKDAILQASRKNRLKVRVETRIKHFYSIYRKMKDKKKDLSEIYDMLGVRILCENTEACYLMLGYAHRLWAPLEGRFKDYIARPKDNRYQSLHTTVLTQGGQSLEIQIRTKDMHATAEYGEAAHWVYKEKKKKGAQSHLGMVDKIKLLQEEGHDDDAREFLETIKRDILRNSIIVYTPKGDPVELPEGSTAIDFAYQIHTEIGDHCQGAKANGSMITLTRPLLSTETITILTSSLAHPHVNWLKHVRSTRARSKIRSWLNKHDGNVVIDRNIVARKKTGILPKSPPPQPLKYPPGGRASPKRETQRLDKKRVGISIGKERNMLIHLAQCCHPLPGDPIIGYISRGRGIIVHKDSCSNLGGIQDFEERMVQVDWETASTKKMQRFQLRSRYTQDILSDIENVLQKYQGHLIAGSIHENERGSLDGFFTVEMGNQENFNKIVKSIRALPAIVDIQKVQTHPPRNYG